MAEEQNDFKTGLWWGMGAGLVINGIAALIIWLTGGGPILIAIGLLQIVYITPLSLFALLIRRYGQGISVGMWIMAGIIFLLNMIGCGIMVSGLSHL
ncbi:hypothetical protein [Tumebacillus flagellatus]|uniref:Uncharacterized protein n=1 Tax=Tumebacillus flagellatus TaxID=1157490 RepID=A0A074LR47_9BACL|nr:hypothetical protein [Tumebacillus flagellatus]KEO82298.1 hypothetical protein EL26_16065 [Tumebacillus flagellatus]